MKLLISKVWTSKDLCKDLGYVHNNEGTKVAIELYENKGHIIIDLTQIDKSAMAHFDNEYPLDSKANDKTINRHSDAEYYFMIGVKWIIHQLVKTGGNYERT